MRKKVSISQKCTWKNRIEYFWMYYKIPVFAGIIAVWILISFLSALLQQKEEVLNVILFDSHSEMSGEKMAEKYMEEMGMDNNNYDVTIQNSYFLEDSASNTYAMAGMSDFYAAVGTEKLDVCGMLEEEFANYVKSGCYVDLSNYLTAEQMQQIENRLYRTDDGKVYGIYVNGLLKMQESGSYLHDEKKAIIGIIYNTPHLEEALCYVKYMVGL